MTDPRTRLISVMLVGLLAITLESPEALGVLTSLSAAALIRAEMDPQWWRRALGVSAMIVWGTMLSQGLFYAEQPRVAWLQLGPLTLWRGGVLWGLVQSLRLLAVTMAGLALAISTPTDRIFAGLIRLRMPYGLAFMAVTALRFVPQVAAEVQTVHRARSLRGRPILHRSPLAILRLELMLLQPVAARALRRARVLAESLDARGFDPSAPRTERRPLQMPILERIGLGLAVLVVVIIVTARMLMLLYTSGTLYFPELRGLYGAVRDWL